MSRKNGMNERTNEEPFISIIEGTDCGSVILFVSSPFLDRTRQENGIDKTSVMNSFLFHWVANTVLLCYCEAFGTRVNGHNKQMSQQPMILKDCHNIPCHHNREGLWRFSLWVA